MGLLLNPLSMFLLFAIFVPSVYSHRTVAHAVTNHLSDQVGILVRPTSSQSVIGADLGYSVDNGTEEGYSVDNNTEESEEYKIRVIEEAWQVLAHIPASSVRKVMKNSFKSNTDEALSEDQAEKLAEAQVNNVFSKAEPPITGSEINDYQFKSMYMSWYEELAPIPASSLRKILKDSFKNSTEEALSEDQVEKLAEDEVNNVFSKAEPPITGSKINDHQFKSMYMSWYQVLARIPAFSLRKLLKDSFENGTEEELSEDQVEKLAEDDVNNAFSEAQPPITGSEVNYHQFKSMYMSWFD